MASESTTIPLLVPDAAGSAAGAALPRTPRLYSIKSGVPRNGKALCCSLPGVAAPRIAALTCAGVASGFSAISKDDWLRPEFYIS